jgi:hypothetical protein
MCQTRAGVRQISLCQLSPLLKMRRWFRISWQHVAEYRKGSKCAEIVRVMAGLRSKRHRDTSVRRAVPVEAAMEQNSDVPNGCDS